MNGIKAWARLMASDCVYNAALLHGAQSGLSQLDCEDNVGLQSLPTGGFLQPAWG